MKRFLKIAPVVGVALFGLVFLVSRIDRSEPLTGEQLLLKPGAVEIGSDSAIDTRPYADFLAKNAQSPTDYVIEKFKAHDLVMLGESHQIQEDCDFIASLIEPLYHGAGVRYLGMEIVKEKRNRELEHLLTAPAYDSARVTAIFREDYFYWGFQEYLDILRAVWAFNQTLVKGEAPFRIVGFQPDIDVYRTDCGTLLQKLPEFPRLLKIEDLYAAPLEDLLDKHEKVLVQVGVHHSFLKYRAPKVINGKMLGEFTRERMGHILYSKYGDRVFQIALHPKQEGTERYMEAPTTPVAVLLERLYDEHGGVPMGFDIVNSPLAMLRDTSGGYFAFQKHATLSDIAQGYIMHQKHQNLHCVKWVQNFVNASNLGELRTYATQRGLIRDGECETPEELNAKFSELLRTGIRFP